MGQQTPLYQKHQQSNGKIVDFAGWDMPLHYGSQLEEHQYVRQDAGMFDVSHMCVMDINGPDATLFLQNLLANDVAKLKTLGKALYSCMLNADGGVVDDLIAYKFGETHYRLVVNAGTREKDLAWINSNATGFQVQITPRPELAILAIQGPNAVQKATSVFASELADRIHQLSPFEALEYENYCIARTGYTGEDGLEVMVPGEDAPLLWDKWLAVGIKPCGLGARDTLRLEAGMNLYGADMDEKTSPLEANLTWTVALESQQRNFIGRAALELKKTQLSQRLVGLVLEQKGVLRNHQKVVVPGIGEGEITSGSFSPTLQQAIALARVPLATGDHCLVDIRGQLVPARVVKPPFVRKGKKAF